ncbi:MAG TPA: DUF1285 domain-containing protein [Hyphomicrobiaceae bacterium]|nr:DUF1285 domain-containing protein [Hyphomicrobiaceae bacterium]
MGDKRPDAGNAGGNRIQGLEGLLKAQAGDRLPPVDQWNPPYCGDIGMEIRVDGTWYYQGSPIGRKPLVRLFSRVLRRDEDGRHYLVTPVEKIDVQVADAPFLAVELEIENAGPAQTLVFRTNVDDVVRCGPDHPMRFEVEEGSGGLKPYLLVRGRLEALVTRALYYDLVEMAVARSLSDGNSLEEDHLGLWSDGAFFEMK